MSQDYLKGNYQTKPVKKEKEEAQKGEEGKGVLETAFEKEALERLGGSIAFVKKSSSFVWKGQK